MSKITLVIGDMILDENYFYSDMSSNAFMKGERTPVIDTSTIKKLDARKLCKFIKYASNFTKKLIILLPDKKLLAGKMMKGIKKLYLVQEKDHHIDNCSLDLFKQIMPAIFNFQNRKELSEFLKNRKQDVSPFMISRILLSNTDKMNIENRKATELLDTLARTIPYHHREIFIDAVCHLIIPEGMKYFKYRFKRQEKE